MSGSDPSPIVERDSSPPRPIGSQCAHLRPNGSRCRAKHINSSTYCFFHDPAKAEARKECAERGGKAKLRDGLEGWQNSRINDARDVRRLLARCINSTAAGRMHPRVANAIAVLSSTYLRALESGELEKRLTAIERKLEEMLL